MELPKFDEHGKCPVGRKMAFGDRCTAECLYRDDFCPEVLYPCDPELNTLCNKRGCKHNKQSRFPVCSMTTHKEFAQRPLPEEINSIYRKDG